MQTALLEKWAFAEAQRMWDEAESESYEDGKHYTVGAPQKTEDGQDYWPLGHFVLHDDCAGDGCLCGFHFDPEFPECIHGAGWYEVDDQNCWDEVEFEADVVRRIAFQLEKMANEIEGIIEEYGKDAVKSFLDR